MDIGSIKAEDLLSMSYGEVEALVLELGEKKYRAKQLYDWLMKGEELSGMTNLPESFKTKLSQVAYVNLPKIKKKLVSQIDGTVKYLFELKDGETIESVVMKYNHGNSICISSQAGCRMGCKFCASTLNGLSRSLRPSEILGQVITAQRDIGERISNIVMMGIGEPLDNYDNVIKFLKLVGDKNGLNISYRRISLSTCGLADRIKQLAGENFPITLSISLHSVDNEERKKIMPITNRYSVDQLLSACKYYFEKTGRRISFEYTLISGENDSVADAHSLAAKLNEYFGQGMPFHVNLIPLNDVSERNFAKSGKNAISAFCRELERCRVNATVRRHLGADINASCGQLRYSSMND